MSDTMSELTPKPIDRLPSDPAERQRNADIHQKFTGLFSDLSLLQAHDGTVFKIVWPFQPHNTIQWYNGWPNEDGNIEAKSDLYYDVSPETLGLDPRGFVSLRKIGEAPSLVIRSGRVIKHWSTPKPDDDFIINVFGSLAPKTPQEIEKSNPIIFRLFSDGTYGVSTRQIKYGRGLNGLTQDVKYDKIPDYNLASDFWEKAYNSARILTPEFEHLQPGSMYHVDDIKKALLDRISI